MLDGVASLTFVNTFDFSPTSSGLNNRYLINPPSNGTSIHKWQLSISFALLAAKV
jgi:hypothetical protein